MQKITIIGTGYVGLIAGVCFANKGHSVCCLDLDKSKVDRLAGGVPTIYEEGLKEALKKAISAKKIKFSTNPKEAVEHGDVIFIAVGTPQKESGEANLEYVDSAAMDIGRLMKSRKIVVNKCTVPVGTADRVSKIIGEELDKRIFKGEINRRIDFAVVSNPEFLAEGSALMDFDNERIVIGAENESDARIIAGIYTKGLKGKKEVMITDPKTSELIKYASNTMLALRVSFMNELSELSEKVGADIKQISYGMGLDDRIGAKFLSAGPGYGGSCFPKDVRALSKTMEKYGCENKITRAIDEVNERQKKKLFSKTIELVKSVKGKKIAVLGLAYKPKTDDVRESPAIVLIRELKREGARVSAFDPKAEETMRKIISDIEYAKDTYDAIKGSSALIIVTDWKEFKEMDLKKVLLLMKEPNIVDGRNLFNPSEMHKMGFLYKSIGRR